ncbi:MAG: hypothetical protein JWM98_815 [Thermoleophilia bacterium]|nr:hypothetical protein [Thermoleophilia bacterium]
MHMGGHAHAANGAPHARRSALASLLPALPLHLPATLPLGDFSRAGGPWTTDWARAHRDAEAAVAAIDFSRRDVVLWIPGTDGSGVHRDFARAAGYIYGDSGDASVSHMPYEASWDLGRSLPTGLATMRLMLAGIRERFAQLDAAGLPRPRLLLAGLSQGAWIIGEAMANPEDADLVTRAITVGHPWLARHQYTDGHDPRVKVINHVSDQITMPVAGNARTGLDAMSAVKTGHLMQHLGLVAAAILANPLHGLLLLQTQLREVPALRPLLAEPHNYVAEMPRMVQYLRTGVLDQTNDEIEAAQRAKQA